MSSLLKTPSSQCTPYHCLLLRIAAAILLFTLLTFCNNKTEDKEAHTERETVASSPTDTTHDPAQKRMSNVLPEDPLKTATLQAAKAVAAALHDRNMQQLLQYVHPQKGLLLSPYAYIDLNNVKVLPRKELAHFFEDSTKYVWGSYDGSGEDIALTPAKYYDQFIYDHDYLQAPVIAFDSVPVKGNSTNNIKEIFPGAHYIVLHFPGFDKQYEGMDRKSLYLVFETIERKQYLVAVVHDQWTI